MLDTPRSIFFGLLGLSAAVGLVLIALIAHEGRLALFDSPISGPPAQRGALHHAAIAPVPPSPAASPVSHRVAANRHPALSGVVTGGPTTVREPAQSIPSSPHGGLAPSSPSHGTGSHGTTGAGTPGAQPTGAGATSGATSTPATSAPATGASQSPPATEPSKGDERSPAGQGHSKGDEKGEGGGLPQKESHPQESPAPQPPPAPVQSGASGQEEPAAPPGDKGVTGQEGPGGGHGH